MKTEPSRPVRNSQVEDQIQAFVGTSDVSNPYRANNYTVVRVASAALNINSRVPSAPAGTKAESDFGKLSTLGSRR